MKHTGSVECMSLSFFCGCDDELRLLRYIERVRFSATSIKWVKP